MFQKIEKLIDNLGDNVLFKEEFGGVIEMKNSAKNFGGNLWTRWKVKRAIKKELQEIIKFIEYFYEVEYDPSYQVEKYLTFPLPISPPDKEYTLDQLGILNSKKRHALRRLSRETRSTIKSKVKIGKINVKRDVLDGRGIVVSIFNNQFYGYELEYRIEPDLKTTILDKFFESMDQHILENPKTKVRPEFDPKQIAANREMLYINKIKKDFTNIGINIEQLSLNQFKFIIRACELDERAVSYNNILFKMKSFRFPIKYTGGPIADSARLDDSISRFGLTITRSELEQIINLIEIVPEDKESFIRQLDYQGPIGATKEFV